MQGVNPVRERPLVKDAEGNYLCTNWGNLFYGLRPALEGAIKVDQKLLERYNRIRADFVERTAAEALASALRTTTMYTNVKYWDNGDACELDGLVIADTVAVLVEAKGVPSRACAPRCAIAPEG